MEKILRHKHERSAWQRTRLRELEDQGYGIIDGGQTGQDSWDVTDWHTGEVLLSGTGGLHDYDRAVDDADPHGRWLHSDRAFSEDEGKWLTSS